MLSDTMAQALNAQLSRELASSYLYLSMSSAFEEIDMAGGAYWMRMQAQEEALHAVRCMDYIHERDAKVTFATIDAPESGWTDALSIFEATLAHERQVTSHIHDLMDLAIAERDHASQAFLRWFVSEQVEEEATAHQMIQKLRLIKGDGMGLYMIDQELARRPAPAPAGVGAA